MFDRHIHIACSPSVDRPLESSHSTFHSPKYFKKVKISPSAAMKMVRIVGRIFCFVLCFRRWLLLGMWMLRVGGYLCVVVLEVVCVYVGYEASV